MAVEANLIAKTVKFKRDQDDSFRSWARGRVAVTGLDSRDVAQCLENGLDAARVAYPSFDADGQIIPFSFGIPQIFRTGNNQAMVLVDMSYGFNQNRATGSGSFQQIARVRNAVLPALWWHQAATEPLGSPPSEPNHTPDVNGLNIVDDLAFSAFDLPTPVECSSRGRVAQHRVEIPYLIIEVPVESDTTFSNPTNDLLVATINDAPYTLGGKAWPRHTLRWDGYTMNVYQTGVGTYKYRGVFKFAARIDGWFKSTLICESDELAASRELMYTPSTFVIPVT